MLFQRLNWFLSIFCFLSLCQISHAESADFSFTQDDLNKGSNAQEVQGSTYGQTTNRQAMTQTYSMTIFTDQVGDPGKAPIRQYFEEKLGIKLDGSGPPGEQNLLLGDYPNFLVCYDGNYVLMTMSDSPREFSESEMRWLYATPQLQSKLDEHPSYIHVEMIQMRYSMDEREAFRILSVFATGIINPSATRAIASFSLERAVVFDPSQLEILTGDNPRDLFYMQNGAPQQSSLPAQPRKPPAPQRKASSAISLSEARDRTSASFDKFKRSYSSRALASNYRVLSIVSEDDRSELVWLEIEAFIGNDVQGTVVSSPRKLLEVRKDDIIRVEHGSLVNWKILSPEGNDQAIDPVVAIASGIN